MLCSRSSVQELNTHTHLHVLTGQVGEDLAAADKVCSAAPSSRSNDNTTASPRVFFKILRVTNTCS